MNATPVHVNAWRMNLQATMSHTKSNNQHVKKGGETTDSSKEGRLTLQQACWWIDAEECVGIRVNSEMSAATLPSSHLLQCVAVFCSVFEVRVQCVVRNRCATVAHAYDISFLKKGIAQVTQGEKTIKSMKIFYVLSKEPWIVWQGLVSRSRIIKESYPLKESYPPLYHSPRVHREHGSSMGVQLPRHATAP